MYISYKSNIRKFRRASRLTVEKNWGVGYNFTLMVRDKIHGLGIIPVTTVDVIMLYSRTEIRIPIKSMMR